MKSEKMENTLDNMARSMFGRGRNEGCCVTCGSDKIRQEDFVDKLSFREYNISRMCQECQNTVFGVPE